ncbi:hypothetical protein ACIQC9_04640 [Brevundimonas sp. NPDC092305]|uniref:hypothetical protein n=1 Tax=Brevundimonas sp. NPDC092305 TaxID=3363957 RepID=UPI00380CEC7B
MKIEPNLLVAAVTACALGLLVIVASLFGGPEATLRYVATAFVCIAVALAFSRMMLRMRGRVPRPLIRAEAPGAAIWMGVFPLVVLATAILPMMAPKADYTLMVVIAAIWTAVTLQSAFAARRTA